MTIKKILQSQTEPEAVLFLSFILRKEKEFIYAHPEQELGIFKFLKFKRLWRLFKKGWPLAYLTGHKEFLGLVFLVNKNVLIPRPETELMVEETIKVVENKKNTELLYIDIGTGSGCIPISVKTQFKNLPTIAVDISTKALRTAKQNAAEHKVKIDFIKSDLLKKVYQKILNTNFEHLIITANLPYLTDEQFIGSPSIQREPKKALVADKQGLGLYEELLGQMSGLIEMFRDPSTPLRSAQDDASVKFDEKNKPLKLTAFFEIDPSQTEQIKKMIKKELPEAAVEIEKDHAGRDRIVKLDF